MKITLIIIFYLVYIILWQIILSLQLVWKLNLLFMAKFRIKEICRDKGITKKELAEKIGITAVGLAKAIAGNTTIGTLEKVADALGVDVVELFAEKEDFVAFVRDKGQIYVFNTIKALKEFTDTANKCANSMRQIGVAVECIKEGE